MAQTDALIVPRFDDESRGFWEGTEAGELRIQVCTTCHSLRFPPRPMCPKCQSTKRSWQKMSGKGEIWSFVVPHPPLLPAYSELAPYNVIVVALLEDPKIRLVGNLVEEAGGPPGEIDPESISIGEPVSVVFSTRTATDGRSAAMPEWVRASV